MPDPNPNPTPDPTDKEAIKAQNDLTIRQQQQQDINAQPTGLVTLDPIESLTKLRDELAAKKKAENDPPSGDPPAGDPPAGDPPVVKPKPDVIPAEPATPSPTATPPAADPATDPKLQTLSDTIFKDTPVLPPNASPKANESFTAIKLRAAQEVSARDAEIEKLRKELSDASEKLKNPVPEDVQKELKELREFRLKLDIDADPAFREFDAKVVSAREFIYAQLAKVPTITPQVLEEIKSYGGPDQVNMDTILATIKDSTTRRLIENRLGEIENLNFEKEQSIKRAKGDVQKYMQERQQAFEQMAGVHVTKTREAFDEITKGIAWLQPKEVNPKADENARRETELHNKFISDSKNEIEEALKDDSPQMRATLLVGMLNYFRTSGLYKAAVEALEKTSKELTDARATLERLKGASVSRLRDSGAPPSNGVPRAPQPNIFSETAADALSRLRQQKIQASQNQ